MLTPPSRFRTALAAALLVALAPAAAAQWPTTEWEIAPETALNASTVTDAIGLGMTPHFELLAEKHRRLLASSSRWFESLGFAAPFQRTVDGGARPGPGNPYLALLKSEEDEMGSSHGADGHMRLTSHEGFLTVDTPIWDLMEASAIHEVVHATQREASASYRRWELAEPRENALCSEDNEADWLIEGVAAMIQIRWLEGRHGAWGHPFRGSSRAAWVRHFDQSLTWGALPVEHRWPGPRPEMTAMETVSWACDYGTWYFWYAVGDLIGRTPEEAVAYTRFLIDDATSWADGGLASADAGLRRAAEAYDAIGPYRGGFYDLYPAFVAQYLTEDRFFGGLTEVTLEPPGLFDASSEGPATGALADAPRSGPLEPLEARAWRVRVPVPADASSDPVAVRFSLEAVGATDRDDLHLVVGEAVAGRPALDTSPYTAVVRTDALPRDADGAATVLVRVVNVADGATDTAPARFALRVEADGFYGAPPPEEATPTRPSADPDAVAEAVGGALPPGFAVSGPGPWACRGGASARAVFDLMTPDELGQDVDRMLPEFAQDVEDQLDQMEIAMRRAEQMGAASGMTREQMAELRAEARAALDQARAEAQPDVDATAAELRARPTTTLAATFVGSEAGADCQMTLGAQLLGREGGAQIVPGAVDADRYPDGEAPSFGVAVFPQDALDAMRRMGGDGPLATARMHAAAAEIAETLGGWQVCRMTDADRRRARESAGDCPPVLCTTGQLVLEAAEQGRIAGTFQFEVLRWPEERTGRCHVPEARDTVTGHFNVASTDDGTDDNSLSGLGLGTLPTAGPLVMPGMPILD